MKKITVKCSKCGKEWQIDSKSALKLIECPHCHKQMCVDPDTQKKMKYVRYGVMLVIACAFAWGMQQFSQSENLAIVLTIVALAFILMRYIDNLCGTIAFNIFHFNYMDLDEYAKIRKPTLGERMKKK